MTNNVVTLKSNVITIPISSISMPVFEARVKYDEEKIAELAGSIKQDGLLHPLLVTSEEDGVYELIAGSRRLRATKLLGYTDVPVTVMNVESSAQAFAMTLLENIQREDLDPFEEARAFLRMIKEYGMTQAQITKRLNLSGSYVRRRLALIALPEVIQDNIASGEMGLNFAETLIRVNGGDKQSHYASLAVEKGLSQSELNAVIASDKDKNVEISSAAISFEKLMARILINKRWYRKIPEKIDFRRLSTQERSELSSASQDLETIIRTARALTTPGNKSTSGSIIRTGNIGSEPKNHNEEWTTRELRLITASDRPADSVLAKQLGRTTGAIAGMRSKINEKRKP